MLEEDYGLDYGEDFEEAEDIAAGLSAVLNEGILRGGSVDRWVSDLLARLSPAESESVMSALRDVGRAVTSKEVRQAVGGALPVAGGIIGTVYGGPAGAAIGGSLGQAAGQAVSGRPAAAARAPKPAPAPAAAPAPGATPAVQGGSQAAGQLLRIVQDPAALQSMLQLLMGTQAKTTVPVGQNGTEVSAGALMTLIGMLANRAAEDAEDMALTGAAGPAYLRDDEGNYVCDPASPEERAEALLRLIESADEPLYPDS
jgi:hypothetical protein